MNMQYSIGIRGLACKVLKLGRIKVNSDLFLTESSRGPSPLFKRELVHPIGTRPSPSQPRPLVTHPSPSRPSTIIKGLLCRVYGLEGNSVCSAKSHARLNSWWPSRPQSLEFLNHVVIMAIGCKNLSNQFQVYFERKQQRAYPALLG